MWEIQLKIANNFISSTDNDDERVMHSKSDNIEITISDETDEVMKELFDSLKNRFQNNLESVNGSEFTFHYVNLMYCKCHKIKPNRGGSSVDSPDWIKNKKATINPNKIFPKKKKKKSKNMAMNVTKISQEMQNKSLLSIEKKYYTMRKNSLL